MAEEKLRDLLKELGMDVVLMPVEEYKAEHKRLIRTLRQSGDPASAREADAQEAEVAKEVGGSKASGYVRRLVAEKPKTVRVSRIKNPSANLLERFGKKAPKAPTGEIAITPALKRALKKYQKAWKLIKSGERFEGEHLKRIAMGEYYDYMMSNHNVPREAAMDKMMGLMAKAGLTL